jgi:hypothetical protein
MCTIARLYHRPTGTASTRLALVDAPPIDSWHARWWHAWRVRTILNIVDFYLFIFHMYAETCRNGTSASDPTHWPRNGHRMVAARAKRERTSVADGGPKEELGGAVACA